MPSWIEYLWILIRLNKISEGVSLVFQKWLCVFHYFFFFFFDILLMKQSFNWPFVSPNLWSNNSVVPGCTSVNLYRLLLNLYVLCTLVGWSTFKITGKQMVKRCSWGTSESVTQHPHHVDRVNNNNNDNNNNNTFNLYSTFHNTQRHFTKKPTKWKLRRGCQKRGLKVEGSFGEILSCIYSIFKTNCVRCNPI